MKSIQKLRIAGAALAAVAIVAAPAVAAPGGNGNANANGQSTIYNARLDPGSQQLVIVGSFRASGATVTFDGAPLQCPSYTTDEIRCDYPGLPSGTYRLAVGSGIGGLLQSDSTIDVTILVGDADSHTNVRHYGARGDGTTDDSAAIQSAIAAAPVGGTLYFPRGNYRVSDTFVIQKRINVRGDGYGSQIFQTANQSLFVFEKRCNICGAPSNLIISDLYLGSVATSPGAALIRLTNGSHNLLQNITMLGSYYGIHLQGALINNLVSIRSGNNLGGFFASGQLSTNQYWVFGER
ncbi:MAG: glycosyl hydrolase family 28-related protein [Burkholderiaceae bacterium]